MPEIAAPVSVMTGERQIAARVSGAGIIAALIAIAYVAAEIAIFSIHEPWLDEAQAWLKAASLEGWQFFIIPGEGHPPLWFWLLKLLQQFVSFDQARVLMLGITALNAFLLTRLLGDKPLLMLAFMGTLAVLHSWGFHFRPYPLILTCILGTLLLERAGRPVLATWLVTLACGLSFIAGTVMAFWLLILLRRGVPLRQLIVPALVAAAFGLSAILSSSGNNDAGQTGEALIGIVNSLAFPFAIPFVPAWLNVIISWSLLIYGLRRSPYVLGCLLGTLSLLALFGGLIFGMSEWHAAYGIMLALMAFTIARAPVWPLILVLVPQFYFGIEEAILDLRMPADASVIMYEAVAADAGDRLDTERNLVVWPDHLLPSAALQHGFRFVSGNNGAVMDDVDWPTRNNRDIATRMLQTKPGPYWLICALCERPLAWVYAAGRQATIVQPRTYSMTYAVTAYRID